MKKKIFCCIESVFLLDLFRKLVYDFYNRDANFFFNLLKT